MHNVEEIVAKKIRIKQYVDSYGDVVYVIQRKHWYGWTSCSDILGCYKIYTSINAAIKDANKEIQRMINKLQSKTNYIYFPFEESYYKTKHN